MIRKPDARDFRESGTVSALRDAGTLAVEGAKGVRQGTTSFIRTAFMLIMGFGFLMSMIGHLGPVGLLLVAGGGLAWFLSRRQAGAKQAARDSAARWSDPLGAAARAGVAPFAPVSLELSVAALGRKAATIAVPAILFFPTSGLFTFMAPFTVGAIVALALAILLVARLKGDRTVLRYDAETLTVVGLLGEATMMWADVGDVTVRKAAFWDVRTIYTSGSRRNLVVLGRGNRLGGPDTLYVPIDLLGLDQPALARLVSRFIMLRGGADPSRLAQASPPIAPARPPQRPAPVAPLADAAFDPDAIIARYLADRDQLRAEQRPDLPAPRRASFGRKVA